MRYVEVAIALAVAAVCFAGGLLGLKLFAGDRSKLAGAVVLILLGTSCVMAGVSLYRRPPAA